MLKPSRNLILILVVWLITRVVFYSIYHTYVVYDEIGYMYSSQHLLELKEGVTQGPMIYLLTWPLFKAGFSYSVAKLPFIFIDLAILLSIYFICRRKNEKIAIYASLFYLISPMNLRDSYHVHTDMIALLSFLLAGYFFARYHAESNNKYLIYSAILATISGLTKEIIFCFYIVLMLYLLIQHCFIKRVDKKVVISTLALIVVSNIAIRLINNFLWIKNSHRTVLGFVLDFFRSGNTLSNGIIWIVLIYFLFLNPVTAIFGIESLKRFIKRVWERQVSVDWWSNYQLISLLSFGVIALFFAAYILVPLFVAYLAPFYAIYAAEGFQKYDKKIIALLLGFAVCFAIVVEYEQDAASINNLAKVLDDIPSNTVYADTQQEFIRAVLNFKVKNKILKSVTLEELPLLAKDQTVYVFTSGKDHEEAFDGLLNKTKTPYVKIRIYVSTMERYIYGIGPDVHLPRPERQYESLFMQPIRTSIEERLFNYLISLKRRYCADPWLGKDKYYNYVCLWEKL